MNNRGVVLRRINILFKVSIMALFLSTAASSLSATGTTTTTTATSTPIPPPPSVSVPVYSLATTFNDPSDESLHMRPSMNIVTYATPVSVNPRLYMVSLYHGTMTRDAFQNNRYAVLQLLDQSQADLVPILGKRSGYEYKHNLQQGRGQGQGQGQGYSKEEECRKAGHAWVQTPQPHGSSHFCFGSQSYLATEEKETFLGMKLLPRCQSYIQLEMVNAMEAGDHEMALCRVLGVGEWDEERNCVVDLNSRSGSSSGSAADVSSGCNSDGGDDGDVIPLPAKAKDKESVLYTGYLRKKGIL